MTDTIIFHRVDKPYFDQIIRTKKGIFCAFPDSYNLTYTVAKIWKELGFLTFTVLRKGNALLIPMDTNLVFLAIRNFVTKITGYWRSLGLSL